MPEIFSPLVIRNVKLKNRIVVSPMCQYSSTDGYANDWHLVHLGSRAIGGAALIIAEATAVAPEGRITPGDLGIWDDGHLDGLKRITSFIHAHGGIAGIQLAHAGRKASFEVPWKGGKQLSIEEGGWVTVAPSAIPFRPGERPPGEADHDQILHIISSFKNAAKRAFEAGFKVIEIHGAHGYLIHEFMSPVSNHRTDEYGGSFENRIRLLCEVVKSVREEWPLDLPLFVRISASEWSDIQFSPEEAVRLAPVLKALGTDLIDCSSGGNIYNAKIPSSPGYQVQFAEAMKKTGIMSGAVGQITDARQAEEIIAGKKADLVFLAREHLRNPYFALSAAHDFGVDVPWPEQYERGKRKL